MLTTIESLPNELLIQIIDYARTKWVRLEERGLNLTRLDGLYQTLLALSLTTKRFHSLARPFLFSELYLHVTSTTDLQHQRQQQLFRIRRFILQVIGNPELSNRLEVVTVSD